MRSAKLVLSACLLMASFNAFSATQASPGARDEKSCAIFVQGVLDAYTGWGGKEQNTGYSAEEIKRIQEEKGSCAAQDRINEATKRRNGNP